MLSPQNNQNNRNHHPQTTTTIQLSNDKFNQGVKLIVELFTRYVNGQNNDSISKKEKRWSRKEDGVEVDKAIVLHSWELKKCGNEYYLSHPPLLQRMYSTNNVKVSNDGTNNSNEDCCGEFGDENEYEDEGSTLVDDPAVARAEEMNTASISHDDIEWTFSIVYSCVWSVPILYFQMQ